MQILAHAEGLLSPRQTPSRSADEQRPLPRSQSHSCSARPTKPPAEGRADKLRLDFNENTSGCGPAVPRALHKLTPQQLAMYPEYAASLPAASPPFPMSTPTRVAPHQRRRRRAACFFRRLRRSRHGSILICEPTFPMYRYYAEIAGARVELFATAAKWNSLWTNVISRVAKKAAVIFIANPNNPTGTLVAKPQVIEKILLAATEHRRRHRRSLRRIFRRHASAPGFANIRNSLSRARFQKLQASPACGSGRCWPAANPWPSCAAPCRHFPSTSLPSWPPKPPSPTAWPFKITCKKPGGFVTGSRPNLTSCGIKTFPSAGNFLLADFGLARPRSSPSWQSQGILSRERSDDIGPGFVRISIGTRSEMAARLIAKPSLIRNRFRKLAKPKEP